MSGHISYLRIPPLSRSPDEIRVGITLVFFLCYTVVMRDFLCKVYDKVYCFLGYTDMRLIQGYESGGKGCARISLYIRGLRPLFPFIFLVRSTSSD